VFNREAACWTAWMNVLRQAADRSCNNRQDLTVLVQRHLFIAEAGVDSVHGVAPQCVGNAVQRAAQSSKRAWSCCWEHWRSKQSRMPHLHCKSNWFS